MLGKPQFTYEDVVSFEVKDMDGKIRNVIGKIAVVDRWGTFFDNTDVQYDVRGYDGTFYKHIHEKNITLVEKGNYIPKPHLIEEDELKTFMDMFSYLSERKYKNE